MWQRNPDGSRNRREADVVLIAINLLSDFVTAAPGTELRAIIRVPSAPVVLLYLMSKRMRNYFAEARHALSELKTIEISVLMVTFT